MNQIKLFSLLIIEVYSFETVNRLIRDGWLHEYTHITCELFEKICKLMQCFNCQRYDHMSKMYRYSKKCALCVEAHNNVTCTITTNKRKCVNCSKRHFVWSFQCKIRKNEENRLNEIWNAKLILHLKTRSESTNFSRMKTDKKLIMSKKINKSGFSKTTQMSNESSTLITQSQKETLTNIMYLKTITISNREHHRQTFVFEKIWRTNELFSTTSTQRKRWTNEKPSTAKCQRFRSFKKKNVISIKKRQIIIEFKRNVYRKHTKK